MEGIVLKNSDYQEKSKIIQLFTKEHGLIGVYLKGASDYKNKNYLIAQPITHALFNISYHAGGLSSSFTGDLLNSFSSIKSDFNKNVYVFHLFELLLKTLEQHIASEYLYDLLILVLTEINLTDNILKIETLAMLLETKLLYFLGISPQIDHCVECGSIGNIVNFDVNKGGYVCKNCQDFRSRQFSLDTLFLIRTLYYYNVLNINDMILPNETNIKELRLLLNDYYYSHLGIKTNSMKYFS
ncbi:MAG: repair protein RecO [Haloplasmataceae bacterium]|jgi:DNA repair protein RecO (recombination protein O)|nr:repair protein RecO [Haloplasmataceae bacterium]